MNSMSKHRLMRQVGRRAIIVILQGYLWQFSSSGCFSNIFNSIVIQFIRNRKLRQQDSLLMAYQLQNSINTIYQFQFIMLTPNKKCQRPYHQSFGPLDFELISQQSQLFIKDSTQKNDKQNIAKDVLIQIGQYQMPKRTKNSQWNIMGKDSDVINSWFSPEKSPSKYPHNKQIIKTSSFMRNTKSAAQTPGRHDEDVLELRQQEENNTILNLKAALKKLESPQKKRPKRQTTNKSVKPQNHQQIIEQILKKRKGKSTKVHDLIKLKECTEMKTPRHPQTQRNNNFIISTGKSDIPKRHSMAHKLFNCNPKQELDFRITEQLNLFNQSRRNRTLKKILQ